MNEHDKNRTEGSRPQSGEQLGALKQLDETEKANHGPSPQIYVASLSDYNAGTLHGEWIDADQDTDAIHTQIRDMLERSEEANAEEFAIHDYEGFGSLRIGEYEPIDRVARIASGLSEHGAAFGHWASYCQTEVDAANWRSELERFSETYRGVWPSMVDYAQSLLEEYGLDEMLDAALPEGLRGYVDIGYRAFARDIAGDLYTATDEEGTHVFQPW